MMTGLVKSYRAVCRACAEICDSLRARAAPASTACRIAKRSAGNAPKAAGPWAAARRRRLQLANLAARSNRTFYFTFSAGEGIDRLVGLALLKRRLW